MFFMLIKIHAKGLASRNTMEGHSPLSLNILYPLHTLKQGWLQQILLKILIWSVQSFKIWSRSLASATLFLQSIEWWQEFTSHHPKFPTGANKSSQLGYMWESAIFHLQSKSNMLPLHGTVINYVCIISEMELGGGGKTKSSYRAWIVNLKHQEILHFSQQICFWHSHIDTQFSNLWSKCLCFFIVSTGLKFKCFHFKISFYKCHSFWWHFWYLSKEIKSTYVRFP